MLTIPGSEKLCGTCVHWRGKASLDEAGFVYALKKLHGPCAILERWAEEDPYRAMTLPSHACDLWEPSNGAPVPTDAATEKTSIGTTQILKDFAAVRTQHHATGLAGIRLDGEAGKGDRPAAIFFTAIGDHEIAVGQPLPWPIFDEEANLLLNAGEIVSSQQQLDTLLFGCGPVYRPSKSEDHK